MNYTWINYVIADLSIQVSLNYILFFNLVFYIYIHYDTVYKLIYFNFVTIISLSIYRY